MEGLAPVAAILHWDLLYMWNEMGPLVILYDVVMFIF